MKIAIIGSRNFIHFQKITERIYDFTRTEYSDITIISGGARGVDQEAIRVAKVLGLQTNDKDYKPDFKLGIPRCYFARNDKLIADADKIIAFWDGSSRGTQYVIEQAQKKRKDLEIIFDQP